MPFPAQMGTRTPASGLGYAQGLTDLDCRVRTLPVITWVPAARELHQLGSPVQFLFIPLICPEQLATNFFPQVNVKVGFSPNQIIIHSKRVKSYCDVVGENWRPSGSQNQVRLESKSGADSWPCPIWAEAT